ncbi:helix-turn-helix transcriptional regulator [Kerstersia similis]|uniref:helix-turn-helix transcriptional regulator n=1 Tax=Kerstersia similis TaxID=206505 RepID=UPI0039F0314F
MAAIQHFSMADYRRFGERHGFRYRWPTIEASAIQNEDDILAEGTIQEIPVSHGFTLIVSDVLNHYRYSASSLIAPGFTAILMLDGHTEAHLGSRRETLALTPKHAITASHRHTESMTGSHPAGLRLRSVALMARSAQLADAAGTHVPELAQWLDDPQLRLQHWQADPVLLQAANSLFDPRWQGSLGRLWQEGVALQILAAALNGTQQAAPAPSRPASRDMARLERVKEYLLTYPEHDHTLADLARLACMSSSSLREKFQAAYGQSVFHFLRECRLQLASRGLRQEGWSIEQAAERTGYRHASSFTAAFRRRFGVAPSHW